jgi:hypothetical protein
LVINPYSGSAGKRKIYIEVEMENKEKNNDIVGCRLGRMTLDQQAKFGKELLERGSDAPAVYEDMFEIANRLGVEAALVTR